MLVSFGRDSESIVRWVRRPATPFQESTLSTKETTLLDLMRSRVGEPTSVEQLLEHSSEGPEETLRALETLISAGVLEVAGEIEATASVDDLSDTRAGPTGPSSVQALFPRGAIPEKLGRFEIQEVIGRGSMGAVLLARDPAIDRPVAIKLIQTATYLMPAQQEKYRERFYREASAAGQLQHHSIATVYDVGHTDDGTPFIVMEYLKGTTLREVLDEQRLTVDQALRVARDVLEALSYAHAHGIVHRDIKPGNILVTSDFHGKIMDFGIAHVVGSELTSGDDVLGSPYYMAPEQLSKAKVDQRTDLFSFFVVLYRMLTGRLPFTGDSFAAIAHAILHDSPVSPDRLDPTIDPGLAAIVVHGLNKRPEDRFETSELVQRALDDRARGVGLSKLPNRDQQDRWLTVAIALVVGALLVFRLVLTGHEATTDSSPVSPVTAESGVFETDPSEPMSGPPDEPSPSPDEVIQQTESPRVSATPRPSRQEGAQPRAPRPRPPVEAIPRPRPPVEAAPRPKGPKPQPAPAPLETRVPSEAELFYEARVALEQGELEKSQALLEQLFRVDPRFVGASELHLRVTDQIWQKERVYADSCGLKTAFLGNGGRNAATIFSLRYSSSR